MVKTDHIMDYDIQALVDNELDSEQEREILSYIQSDPELRNRLKELIIQRKLLKLWWLKNRH
jgi:anti-sigma factor RsiW